MTKRKISNILYVFLVYVAFFLARLIYYGINWSISQYGQVPFSQILFHLKVPLTGTSHDLINSFVSGFLGDSLILLLAALIILIAIYILNIRKRDVFNVEIKREKRLNLIGIFKIIVATLTFIYLSYTAAYAYDKLGLGQYIKDVSSYTTIYEEEYKDASEVNITFPENKKNLIYIFAESMETTYSSKEYGGAMESDLMPGLTRLALENQCFGQGGYLNGASDSTNITWTMAGLVAETSGIPLSLPIGKNSYGAYSTFLPGVTSLGDILEDNGYNQMLMMGSDSSFSGTDHYFLQHGGYDIYDLYTAREKGKISDDYFEFWGYEDEKLFQYAKEEILRLASDDKPFNFTMATVDTHFPNGYKCCLCKDIYDNQFQNAIFCSSSQIAEFVEWIKQQDFYKDTVIIIAGDHNNMSTKVTGWYEDKSYQRKTYFTIINSDTENKSEGEARVYTRMDIFPTTLASLGCSIEGDRLGLGTNLYSGKKTLAEEMTLKVLNEELGKTSKLYNNYLLIGD